MTAVTDDPNPASPSESATDAETEETSGSSLKMGNIPWSSALRNGALIVVLLGMLWLAFNVSLPSVEELQQQLDRWGSAAFVIFILIYAVVAVTPIPVTIMAVAGGVLFGVVEGSLLSVAGALLGSWAAYWLARGLGRTTASTLMGRHAETVEKQLERSGVAAVYFLRVMPGLPYWPVNYGAGAFGVTQRNFLVGSALGVVPGQVSLVAIGAFAVEPSYFTGIVLVAAWAAVLIMTAIAFRDLRRTTSK